MPAACLCVWLSDPPCHVMLIIEHHYTHTDHDRVTSATDYQQLCLEFGVQVCWDMSVQVQMHTLWRFDGEPSRMPSVSRALWAACIHSRDGATPPASSTAMASASATREVDIVSLFTGTPF